MVVNRLNLKIGKGEVFGLLGPNGAGKTTTILMLLGLTEPSSGSVHVCGINSTTNPIEVKRRVGYLPENVGFYDDLTGLENLMFTARLNGNSNNSAAQKAEQLLMQVGLKDSGNKKAGHYSRGMLQRLGLADVLIKNPEVIILDEPTLGIDPTGVKEFLELIVHLSKEDGITVLLSSHHLYQVQQVCDRVGLFVKGNLIAEGNINSLSQRLFSHEPFSVEAGFSPDENLLSGHLPGTGHSGDNLKKALENIEGVMKVELKENKFTIGCSRDATNDIARIIIESGAGLSFLNKREYGLDDIYNRYFEGGGNHE